MVYKHFVRPFFFNLYDDPEEAHEQVMTFLQGIQSGPTLLHLFSRLFEPKAKPQPVKVAGITFPNRIGLAAGFDKNGVALHALAALGFGYIVMGTVTPLSQEGNPRPRIFRLEQDRAMINRMGLNNDGADEIADRLALMPKLPVPLGISISKNTATPIEQAVEDHAVVFHRLWDYADYFEINVSCPNSTGVTSLQSKAHLGQLLGALQRVNRDLARANNLSEKPLAVKLSSDLSDDEAAESVGTARDHGVRLIINGNTTVSRDGIIDHPHKHERGGMSGEPLFIKTCSRVRFLRKHFPEMGIVALGGISTSGQVQRVLDVGADLVQIFTGLVFEGPFIVKELVEHLPS